MIGRRHYVIQCALCGEFTEIPVELIATIRADAAEETSTLQDPTEDQEDER